MKNFPSQTKRKRGRPRKQIYEDELPEMQYFYILRKYNYKKGNYHRIYQLKIIILKIYTKIQLINILNLQYSKLFEWNQRKLENKTTWIQQVMNLTSNSAFKFYKQIVSNK